MRVISGTAKGLRLQAPKTDKVRPAADKVKGAIFNILGELSDARVLDLFAGTGSVGIESLSRGAGSCVFVEADRNTASFIERNLRHCGMEGQGQILVMHALPAIRHLARKNKVFDLIFVDPPYDKGWVGRTLNALGASPLLHAETHIVVEHSPRERPEPKEGLEIFDQRGYGQTLITFLKPNRSEPGG